MSSGVNRRCTGSFAGTGAAVDVKVCGFKPTKVEIYNVTGNCQAVWTDTMADAAAQKTVDSGSGTTDMSFITSNGITPLSNGFRLGADTDLNVSAEVVHWVAYE